MPLSRECVVPNNPVSRDLNIILEEEYDPVATDQEDDESDEFYSCTDTTRDANSQKSQIGVKGNWGKSANNWSLWNAWDSSLLEFPLFVNGDATPNLTCDVKTFLNLAFKKPNLEEKGLKPLTDEFLVLRVILQEKIYPFSQQMKMDAHQLIFINRRRTITTKAHHVKLLACAGLAEICRAVFDKSDILIISGGYDLIQTKDKNEPLQFGLNFNKERHTQIIRIPATLHGRLVLYEKIEPLNEEKRYKFTYIVKRGTFQRTVQQHRSFDQDEFCREATDTQTYSRNCWDFQVPIVRSTQALSLYELMCFRGFKIPTIPFQSTNNHDEPLDNSVKNHSPAKKDDYVLTSGVFKSFLRNKRDTTQGAKSRVGNKNDKKFSCRCAPSTFLITLTLALVLSGIIFFISRWSNVSLFVWNKKTSHKNAYDDLSDFSRTDQQHTQVALHKEISNNNPDDFDTSKDVESTKMLSEKKWENTGLSYSIKKSGENFYKWAIETTKNVINWIDVTIRWVRENYNLQRFLAKFGFPINEVLFLN